jgi:multidrug resistance protein, MATE family
MEPRGGVSVLMELAGDIRRHTLLAWPLAMANLLHTLSTVVIFAYLSELGSREVASAALAIATFTPCSVFINGLVSAKIPLFASIMGDSASERMQRRRLVMLAIKSGIIVSLAIMLLLSQAYWLYRASGQDPQVASKASAYLMVLMCSLPLILCINIYRLVSVVYGRGRLVILSGATTLSANALLGWLAISGGYGMNMLAGVNVIANLLGLAILFRASRPLLAPMPIPPGDRLSQAQTVSWQDMLRLGIPSAFNQCLQVGIFNLWFFLIGAFDHRALATFAMSTQLTSLAFVAVSGSAQAVSIQVAAAAADANIRNLWRNVRAAFALVLGLLFVYCGGLIVLVSRFGAFFFGDAANENGIVADEIQLILPFTMSLLALDVMQILFIGILRGLKSTLTPLKISLLGNLGVGVPAAYYLAAVLKMNISGVLLGAIIGSAVSMLILLYVSFSTITWRSASWHRLTTR